MAITRQSRDFPTVDTALQLKDAGVIGASAGATVASAAKIVDVGLARFDGRVIVDISACEVATGDEQYGIIIQGSNSSTFASGVWNLGCALVGDSSKSGESADTVVGRREIAFCNEVNGTLFRYLRAYTFVAGTVATGINYVAYLGQA